MVRNRKYYGGVDTPSLMQKSAQITGNDLPVQQICVIHQLANMSESIVAKQDWVFVAYV